METARGGGELVETNKTTDAKGPCKNQTNSPLGTKFEGNDGGDGRSTMGTEFEGRGGRSTMKMDENHFCFVLFLFL